MGYRISEKTIQNEYEIMQKDGFARERLGWWTPTASEKIDYAINKAKWLKCESDEQKPEGKQHMALSLVQMVQMYAYVEQL